MAFLRSIETDIEVCAEFLLAKSKKLSDTKVEVSHMGDDYYAKSYLSIAKAEVGSKDSWTI